MSKFIIESFLRSRYFFGPILSTSELEAPASDDANSAILCYEFNLNFKNHIEDYRNFI